MMLQSACRIAICGSLVLCPYSVRSPCGVSPSSRRWEYRHGCSSVARASRLRCFGLGRGLRVATPQQQQHDQGERTRLDPLSSVDGESGRKENGEPEDGEHGSCAGVAGAHPVAAGSSHEDAHHTTTTTRAKNRAGRAVNQKVGLFASSSSESVRPSPPSPPPPPPPTSSLGAPAQPSPPLDVLHQDQNFA